MVHIVVEVGLEVVGGCLAAFGTFALIVGVMERKRWLRDQGLPLNHIGYRAWSEEPILGSDGLKTNSWAVNFFCSILLMGIAICVLGWVVSRYHT